MNKRLTEFKEGDILPVLTKHITQKHIDLYAKASKDFNPIHIDPEYAKKTALGGTIAHGMLSMAVATGLANQLGIFEGTTIALLSQTIKYTGAVKFGDTIRLKLKVGEKKESSKPDRGIITFNNEILNQNDEVVVETQWVLMMVRKKD